MSQGDTADDAIAMIEDAMKGWLEAELRKGTNIPEPRLEEEFSGKFIVRVPKSLHRKVSEISSVEEVSLNQWINTTLAEAVGENLNRKESKKEHNDEISSGLLKAINGILTGTYAGNSDLTIDEKTFASWLDSNLQDIFTELKKPSGSQFTEKTRALLNCLTPYQEESPIINSLCGFLFVISDLGEKFSFMMNQQFQISNIISSVNQPVLPREPIPDNFKYTETTNTLGSNIINEIRNTYNVGK